VELVVSGASGFIGSALVPELRAAGHVVRRLVRHAAAAADEVEWHPDAGTIDTDALAGIEGAIHLAGEGIAERRWTDDQKRRILESRTTGTALLSSTLAELDPRPRVLLSGSAVGFYGDRGDEVLTESSPPGNGFLADVVRAWEAATEPASSAGIRTVHLRTGIVLSPEGGAMGKTLPLFKLGLGGPIGRGREWWPWITLEDHVRAIAFLLEHDVHGPANLVAPNPVRNREYTAALGKALHRPAVVPVPMLGPSLLLGRELARSLLGQSQRVVPERLLEAGFEFRHPEIGPALRAQFAA
jgi:uncharacterized protein (TIGR01777 family)